MQVAEAEGLTGTGDWEDLDGVGQKLNTLDLWETFLDWEIE